jgi:hypothetical protein
VNIGNAIKLLEEEWVLEAGFLGNQRQGYFNPEKLDHLISILQSVELPSDTKLERGFGFL